MVSWRVLAEKITDEFVSWGCTFDLKLLPEIAMSYDCSPLDFWNWMDGEAGKTEKSFLRVLGYAWKKCLAEEEDELSSLHSADLVEPETEERIAA